MDQPKCKSQKSAIQFEAYSKRKITESNQCGNQDKGNVKISQ